MTQVERVRRALERGPVNVTDFAAPNVIDGGKPIMRMAARVQELRDQGYAITTRRLSNGTAQYELQLAARATEAHTQIEERPTADGNTDDALSCPVPPPEASSTAASDALAPIAGGALFNARAYTRHHYEEES